MWRVGDEASGYAQQIRKGAFQWLNSLPRSVQRCRRRTSDFPRRRRTSKAKKEPGNYPIPDRGHAISAKRLSKKNRKDGNLTKDEFERINRKADKMLDKTSLD